MKSPYPHRLRLTIDFPKDIYYAIEKGAENSYTSMSIYVTRALIDRFKKEKIKINDSDREYFEKKLEKRMKKKKLTDSERINNLE